LGKTVKTFITENFLLETETARELYFTHAAPQPIYDYHCHLDPRQIAQNHRFQNLHDIWLAGDHYKWRLMRANGIPERLCTGDAPAEEKVRAFIRTLPYALRNPLYHWSHLELLRAFAIDDLIDEAGADSIWQRANARLVTPECSVHGLLDRFHVALVATTDDPADSLDHHRKIRYQNLATRVYPTFRPDAALNVGQPAAFNAWCARLGAAANSELATFSEFLAALRQRHDYFHEQGCRLSDHGLPACFASPCDENQAARIFTRARRGEVPTPEEVRQFGTHLMLFFGHLDAARGWTKQLHLGALRNNNRRLHRALGPDIGCDSIGDFPQAAALGWYLDALDADGLLPKIIVYNLNPADNYALATMLGSFQDGSLPGKLQFGSGWWHLDQLEGMTWQLNTLSNLGLLRRFVGMLTDSRSFLSYTRHEYFRRLFCNLIGHDVERGLLPRDPRLLGALVREVCFENARAYFGLDLDPRYTPAT
jgi:glucuronate isomerase